MVIPIGKAVRVTHGEMLGICGTLAAYESDGRARVTFNGAPDLVIETEHLDTGKSAHLYWPDFFPPPEEARASTIDDIFEKRMRWGDEASAPKRRKRVGATTDSIALVASKNGNGVILEHDGSGIEADIEAIGLGHLSDHGLDDAPDGLSIWEGSMVTSPGPFEYPNDVDCELVGAFRPLTGEEWRRYSDGDTPWEFEP